MKFDPLQVYCFDWWLLGTISLIIWSNFLRNVFTYTQLQNAHFSAKVVRVVRKLGLAHICNAKKFYFCFCPVLPVSEAIVLVYLRADVIWHLNPRTATEVCVLYWLFTKSAFYWWRKRIEILKLLYMRGTVIYSLYTRKKPTNPILYSASYL